ncbi:hypothetical protein J2Z62_000793 [Mycoplasmoides fastidiosum]|uniref:Uncharacterized protein n=1 Tax=Mycoplasmoides fastidiosum TaxID=92758 RepID=A0ABU0M072_9BACT|nr:hypothetical protein [Mycoplasmoides fastidiosum]MDQ0514355.1 hypothetical protein [Mycoplasmoides fastidiosum]UUD38044.1 hypothetical protein NPA10_01455 [Mycoplasmoides fastidiosum]
MTGKFNQLFMASADKYAFSWTRKWPINFAIFISRTVSFINLAYWFDHKSPNQQLVDPTIAVQNGWAHMMQPNQVIASGGGFICH